MEEQIQVVISFNKNKNKVGAVKFTALTHKFFYVPIHSYVSQGLNDLFHASSLTYLLPYTTRHIHVTPHIIALKRHKSRLSGKLLL